MLKVNEKEIAFQSGLKVTDLVKQYKADADLFIVNGYPALPDTELYDGDVCCLIKRGEVPSCDEMEHLLMARHTPGVHTKVKDSVVGIMGLGGLGSVVAGALARVGVGKLVIADYDVVEPSNLNRQQYFIDQIGMKKTVALAENLKRMNPYLTIETRDEMLTEENIPQLFAGVDVLAECFDQAEMKAAALQAVLLNMPDVGYVGASGMAGYEDGNLIVTRRVSPKVYIAGDGETAACPGQGLMAPRVGIAAHHQANQILRILLETSE
jgi:sulfur carrier protein ThiS adenylyltransferase